MSTVSGRSEGALAGQGSAQGLGIASGAGAATAAGKGSGAGSAIVAGAGSYAKTALGPQPLVYSLALEPSCEFDFALDSAPSYTLRLRAAVEFAVSTNAGGTMELLLLENSNLVRLSALKRASDGAPLNSADVSFELLSPFGVEVLSGVLEKVSGDGNYEATIAPERLSGLEPGSYQMLVSGSEDQDSFSAYVAVDVKYRTG